MTPGKLWLGGCLLWAEAMDEALAAARLCGQRTSVWRDDEGWWNVTWAGEPCDRPRCFEVAVEVVHLNPNIVKPLHPDRPGWRPYRYCRAHALAVVDPLGCWEPQPVRG